MIMDEPTEMMRRLASDYSPVETDAPEEGNGANPVPYDVALQQDLLELGPDTLKQYGSITVRNVEKPERYNSAVWYAIGHDLRYELRDNCVIITDDLDPKERINVRSRP